MQEFIAASVYGYLNSAGKVELVRDDEIYDYYTGEWHVPRHNLFKPAELGLHTAQVIRYLSDVAERERLEEDDERLEEDMRRNFCRRCEHRDTLCVSCARNDRSAALDYIKVRAKLAEVDKRIAATLKLAQDALPAARAAREAAAAAPAPAAAPTLAAGGASAGAAAGAGIDHLLLPDLLPLPAAAVEAAAAPVWPLLPPGPEPFSDRDRIDALIDEILARPT
jgi:hypothetical protein